MTRYKKELRKHGYRLECDYPCLPYQINGITLEGVTIKFDNDYKRFVLKEWYVVGVYVIYIDSHYNPISTYLD